MLVAPTLCRMFLKDYVCVSHNRLRRLGEGWFGVQNKRRADAVSFRDVVSVRWRSEGGGVVGTVTCQVFPLNAVN